MRGLLCSLRALYCRPDNEWIKFNEAAAASGFGREGAAIPLYAGGSASSSASLAEAQDLISRITYTKPKTVGAARATELST
jgi:hypothetical protein